MTLDPIQQAARDQFQKQSANYGKSHILANTDDVAAALSGVEAPPGSAALDVATRWQLCRIRYSQWDSELGRVLSGGGRGHGSDRAI